MANRLEHANLTVRDIDATVQFLKTAFPEFVVRGEGIQNGDRWLHVGSDDSYIALNESSEGVSENGPLNHLGFAVDDVNAVVSRLLEAEYREGFIAPEHPHRRRKYFFDADGIEWEFVEYATSDPEQRNDYSL